MSIYNEGNARLTSGAIIRAQNGDILRYDETGLVMVLSDQVVDDIARRLPHSGNAQWIDPSVLGDIDAWDVRESGDWYVFQAHLKGKQGARQFRRLIKSETDQIVPSPIADGSGPIRAILSIGGPRRAMGFDQPLDFPWHVLSPSDDIGAVGHCGEPAVVQTATLEPIRDLTRDAALAEVLLNVQYERHQSMNLFMTRTETDSSTSLADLRDGTAYKNLLLAFDTLKAIGQKMSRPTSLYAIGFDYSLEDITSDANSYRDGVFAFLAQLNADIASRGLRCPPILATFDCGTHQINDHQILRAQWDLAWQGPAHGLTYTAPSYMFKQDRFARPDITAVQHMAEMDAAALDTLHQDKEWLCPTFLLAEREDDPKQIRVKSRAMKPLVIDQTNPFQCEANHGFSLSGATNNPKILTVTVAEDDPLDILITCNVAPEGEAVELLYAFGQTAKRRTRDYPAACGAIRDDWSMASKTGATLHRWALPCALPVW